MYYLLAFLKKEKTTLLSALFYAVAFSILRYYPITHLPNQAKELTLTWKLVTGALYAPLLFFAALTYILQGISLTSWKKYMHITRGFLLYDTLLLILYNKQIASSQELLLITLLHHIIIIRATYYTDRYARLLAQGFLSELTLPLLYYGWYLTKWKLTDTHSFWVVSMTTLCLFFILRVINFSYLLLRLTMNQTSPSKDTDGLAIFGMGILTMMNYYWFYFLLLKRLN